MIHRHDDDSIEDNVNIPCNNKIKSICNLKDEVTFKNSIACIMSHQIIPFESECPNLVNFLLVNLFESCHNDFVNYCLNKGYESDYSFECLFENMRKLDYKCRKEIFSVKSGDVGCISDVNYYCNDLENIDDVPNCLATIDIERLTYGCAIIISDFNECITERDQSIHNNKPCWLQISPSKSQNSNSPDFSTNFFVFFSVLVFFGLLRIALRYRKSKRFISRNSSTPNSTDLATAYYIVDSDSSHYDDGIALTAVPVSARAEAKVVNSLD